MSNSTRQPLVRHRIYGAFAATRLALSRSQLAISGQFDPEKRFWFARFELYIALLIMMDNWYVASGAGDPDHRATRMSNLISQMPCSYTKARQLIEEAVELGYAEIGSMEPDRRVKIVTPTDRTIKIWESYFDDALAIMQDTGLVAMLADDHHALNQPPGKGSKK